MVDSTIRNEIQKRTQLEFDKLKEKASKVELNYLAATKNFIQCSSLPEFHDYKDDKNQYKFARVMKHHNAKLHQNFIKVTKKIGDAQTHIFKDESSKFESMIAVSHPDAYCHASNISRVLVG